MAGALTLPGRGAIACIGFMGAGKSTAARGIAEALGTEAFDVDALLEARFGKPIAEVFAQDGEPAFRAAEEGLTLELLRRPGRPVLALGGGATGSAAVRRELSHPEHLVLWIDVDLDTAWVRSAGSGRPLARERSAFERLFAEREPVYAGLADVTVPSLRSAALAPILQALDGMPAGAQAPVGGERVG